MFVKHFIGDKAEIFYSAEEAGCDLYWTNDLSEVGKCAFEEWDDDDAHWKQNVVYEYVPIGEDT